MKRKSTEKVTETPANKNLFVFNEGCHQTSKASQNINNIRKLGISKLETKLA